MLEDDFINATGLTPSLTDTWYQVCADAADEFQIVSPARLAAWLAQIGHESGSFGYTRELWGPTQAQLGYEGRKDLGNTQPGDGFLFRGRGLIQITGRYNFGMVGDALGVDFINNPASLSEPVNAARSAAWFWSTHGCNELADAGDFIGTTRKINGGMTGEADRAARWAKAKLALGV